MNQISKILLGLSAITMLSGAGLAAQSAFSLQTLEKGQWTLRDKEAGFKPVQRICLGDARKLVRPRHAALDCQVTRLSGNAREAVFNYSCNGARGSTTIRRETDRLVQIRSQGLDHGAPFALDYEARRTGTC